MYYCSECGHVSKLSNYCRYCNKKPANKKKIITIVIVIAIILIIPLSTYICNSIENTNKQMMLADAHTYISNAKIQYEEDNLDNIINNMPYMDKCYYIYARNDGLYKNSGNYIGSILVNNNKAEIWLSDGKYMVTGTTNNLTIIESKLTATKTCNR